MTDIFAPGPLPCSHPRLFWITALGRQRIVAVRYQDGTDESAYHCPDGVQWCRDCGALSVGNRWELPHDVAAERFRSR